MSVQDILLTVYVDARTTKFNFCKLFLAVPFLARHKKNLRMSWQNSCSYKKGSLGRDIPSVGTLVGLLLALTW